MAVAIEPGRRHHECKAPVFYPLTIRKLLRPFYKPPEKRHPALSATLLFATMLPHPSPAFTPCSPLGWRSKFGSLPHVLRHSYEHPKTVSQNGGGMVPSSATPYFLGCSFPAYLKASVCTLWSCKISVAGSFSPSVAQNANLDRARQPLFLVVGGHTSSEGDAVCSCLEGEMCCFRGVRSRPALKLGKKATFGFEQ